MKQQPGLRVEGKDVSTLEIERNSKLEVNSFAVAASEVRIVVPAEVLSQLVDANISKLKDR